jgi:hypothetical protein
VSFHEAEAYARWVGKRLPTEPEWEKAAKSVAGELEHMTGAVWQWTSSSFDGYPGFSAFPYAEYSEAFFGDEYRVLRGGSWVTDPLVARPTFRNWDLPERRQIFSGLRCARDVDIDRAEVRVDVLGTPRFALSSTRRWSLRRVALRPSASTTRTAHVCTKDHAAAGLTSPRRGGSRARAGRCSPRSAPGRARRRSAKNILLLLDAPTRRHGQPFPHRST